MTMQTAFQVSCRKCKATTWLYNELPEGWTWYPKADYIDEFECGNHE
jgi:hypothetical protein